MNITFTNLDDLEVGATYKASMTFTVEKGQGYVVKGSPTVELICKAPPTEIPEGMKVCGAIYGCVALIPEDKSWCKECKEETYSRT